VLKCLADRFGLTSDDARAEDNWALRFAAYNGHVDALKCLADLFGLTAADARAMDNEALRMAVHYGRVDAVEYLVDRVGLTAEDARGALKRLESSDERTTAVSFLVSRFPRTALDIWHPRIPWPLPRLASDIQHTLSALGIWDKQAGAAKYFNALVSEYLYGVNPLHATGTEHVLINSDGPLALD